MRSVFSRWATAVVVALMLAVPSWADESTPPVDSPQARLQPPVVVASQARVQPPVGPSRLQLVRLWLQARFGVPIR